VHVHPDDAARLDISDGAPTRVRSAQGVVVLPAEVTDAVMPGVVSIPHGWGHDGAGVDMQVARANAGVNSNLLAATDVYDPLSGNAVLNGIPVDIAPAG
jgi:anaerobic selenocysteine-containing dehydrogenase